MHQGGEGQSRRRLRDRRVWQPAEEAQQPVPGLRRFVFPQQTKRGRGLGGVILQPLDEGGQRSVAKELPGALERATQLTNPLRVASKKRAPNINEAVSHGQLRVPLVGVEVRLPIEQGAEPHRFEPRLGWRGLPHAHEWLAVEVGRSGAPRFDELADAHDPAVGVRLLPDSGGLGEGVEERLAMRVSDEVVEHGRVQQVQQGIGRQRIFAGSHSSQELSAPPWVFEQRSALIAR